VDSFSRLSDTQQRWVDCVVDIAAMEPEHNHLTSHYVFCKKVLGEPKQDCFQIAVAFRHVELTRKKCERVAVDW
jgi:hypothetical protein